MFDEVRLVDVMAESLGIKRIKGEGERPFVIRCLCSACRFWVEAFCLDDGYGGNEGIRRQLIARRLRAWLVEVSEIYPGILEWFGKQNGGEDNLIVKPLYEQTIMVGDIISENQGRTYRCARPHKVPYANNACALIGLCDVSSQAIRNQGILSGMMISISYPSDSGHFFNEETYNPKWWDLPDAYSAWVPLADLPDVEYFDPSARKWRLREPSSWRPDFPEHAEHVLARTQGAYSNDYYFVKLRKNGQWALQVDTDKALNLSLHVRKSYGKPLQATIELLDDKHAKIRAPFGLLPAETSRWMDYMTWPVRGLEDRVYRIIRRELLESAIHMLKVCELEIKES